MTFEWPWKRQKILLENDLNALEATLEALFKPVSPRPEFVKALRVELVGKPKRKWLSLPNGGWQRGVLLAGGIVSFFAMVLGGFRIVIAILGMFRSNRNSPAEKPAAV
jgi:hypothetical protein